jgi:hypothetical protein
MTTFRMRVEEMVDAAVGLLVGAIESPPQPVRPPGFAWPANSSSAARPGYRLAVYPDIGPSRFTAGGVATT